MPRFETCRGKIGTEGEKKSSLAAMGSWILTPHLQHPAECNKNRYTCNRFWPRSGSDTQGDYWVYPAEWMGNGDRLIQTETAFGVTLF